MTQTATAPPLAAGEYVLEPSHTQVGFLARHLMVSKVRGNFEKFEGKITVGETLAVSGVEVTIDVASLNSRDEKRDTHLRSAELFDVEKYPTMTFGSTAVTAAPPSSSPPVKVEWKGISPERGEIGAKASSSSSLNPSIWAEWAA